MSSSDLTVTTAKRRKELCMSTFDKAVSINPYFKIPDDMKKAISVLENAKGQEPKAPEPHFRH